MLPVIVATDFSDTARNAVHYACHLAQDFNAPVVVLHSFLIPLTFQDTPMPVMPVNEGREIAEERMDELVTDLRKEYPDVQIDGKILFGDVVDSLKDYCREEKPWLIVLGNSGGEKEMLWLGSNVLNAVRNIPHAVLAIPPDYSYRKPAKICLAADFQSRDTDPDISDWILFMSREEIRLHILNVYDSESEKPGIETGIFFERLKVVNPVFHFIHNDEVAAGIEDFLRTEQFDWLAVVPHKYSFFEGLFHKSRTKAILKSVDIPLLSLHEV